MGRLLCVVATALFLQATPFAVSSVLAQQSSETGSQAVAEAVISGQINAFRSRQHDQAFGYAAPNIRTMFQSTSNFIRMVQSGYGAIYGAQSWSYGRVKVDGARMIQEVLLVGPQGRNWVALYTLEQQADGSWKIAGVQLRQGEALST